jgi:hypothetical protein
MSKPGKIVQIAVTSGGEDNAYDNLYALDASGKVWFLPDANQRRKPDQRWERLPALTAENVKP